MKIHYWCSKHGIDQKYDRPYAPHMAFSATLNKIERCREFGNRCLQRRTSHAERGLQSRVSSGQQVEQNSGYFVTKSLPQNLELDGRALWAVRLMMHERGFTQTLWKC